MKVWVQIDFLLLRLTKLYYCCTARQKKRNADLSVFVKRTWGSWRLKGTFVHKTRRCCSHFQEGLFQMLKEWCFHSQILMERNNHSIVLMALIVTTVNKQDWNQMFFEFEQPLTVKLWRATNEWGFHFSSSKRCSRKKWYWAKNMAVDDKLLTDCIVSGALIGWQLWWNAYWLKLG